jgi:hypothetical protein
MATARVKLSDLNSSIEWPLDFFICSASFEARCRSIADHLDMNRFRCALVAENENHKALHQDQMAYLLGKLGAKARPVMLDTTNPLKTADSFLRALDASGIPPDSGVLLDVTTFTHEAVLILFKLVRSRFPPNRIRYVYSSAREYSVGDPIEKKWLSQGVGEIRSVLGYPGEFLPSKKLHLVALVGFEHDRVLELIRNYEPALISLGYATSDQPDSDKHLAVNKQRFQMVKSICGGAKEFTFPCYDPLGTKAAIQQQIKLEPGLNVVVAGLNTKASTLGVGLAGVHNPRIQLCYAQAVIYNHRNYSEPGDYFYQYKLD